MKMIANSCRVCRRPLFSLLDLGMMKLPWFPKRRPDQDPVPQAPLHLMGCDECGLVQLSDTVNPDLLYRQYWYRSTINELMRAELTDVVKKALLQVSVYPEDYVLDIGANDGYLLSQYPRERSHWRTTRVAFEPAHNLKELCAAQCEVLVNDYFPPKQRGAILHHKAKIITSIAMFYDLDDPRRFVEEIDNLLHDDGLWILQMQDLAQMVEAGAIDNVCHEHLTYWSLSSFGWFLNNCGVDLHVVHAERRDINGGSLRIYVRRKAWPAADTVEELLQLEAPGIGYSALGRFAWQADQTKQQVQGFITAATEAGYTVDLYGASTKANTLLQLCGLGPDQLRFAWERNPEKVGRYTATGVPIIAESDGRLSPPDVLFAGIWQFRELILDREAPFLDQGRRILFPLPHVEMVVGHAQSVTPGL